MARTASNVIPITRRLSGRARAVSVVDVEEREDQERYSTGTPAFDRVLGGGLVPGSKTLISGGPGQGKSTLLLRLCADMAGEGERVVLYGTAEESETDIYRRAKRMDALEENLMLIATKHFSAIEAEVLAIKPDVLILDSISTMVASPQGDAGSVSEYRKLGDRIQNLVKKTGGKLAVFIVAHVTKDDDIAGPQSIQHLFDGTLYLESVGSLRRLGPRKNRNGKEVSALFEMTERGLEAINNPSERFLADRVPGLPGSIIGTLCDDSRIAQTTLFEVQALVGEPKVKGQPHHSINGIHKDRFGQILDILTNTLDENFPNPSMMRARDIRVNVVGGLLAKEPSVDLPIALAIASSLFRKAVDPKMVAFGEVGLAGEIRNVPRPEPRLQEAFDMGFRNALAPKGVTPENPLKGFKVTGVSMLSEALDILFDTPAPKTKRKK